jgi:HSP20 family molecular chaperone IbpA
MRDDLTKYLPRLLARYGVFIVKSTDDAVTLTLAVPGCGPDDISAHMDSKALVVEAAGEEIFRADIGFAPTDPTCSVERGVAVVRLPRPQPKRTPISVN